MRLSLSLKFGILSALLVLLVMGVTTYVLVYQFAAEREQELFAQDRELARVLARVRDAKGNVDVTTLANFVGSADKVDLGLVYAIEIGTDGQLRQGALNALLFARLSSNYNVLMRQGRERVLQMLAADKIDRTGLVKEYALKVPSGTLRLGFNLRRIDSQIGGQMQAGLIILAVGLLLGVVAAVGLARNMTRPIRDLAGAMESVARGNMNQTVHVRSSDELASLAGSFNQMMRSLRDMNRIQEIASGYLSPAIMQRLLRADAPLELPVEEKAVTVLAVRLDGALTRTDQRRTGPRDMIAIANEYLAPILDALLAQQATIFALNPTQIIAVFGAPEVVADGERLALRAGIAARDAVALEARRQQVAGMPVLQLSSAIFSGRAALGNIGSAMRHSYTIVGDVVAHAVAAAQICPGGQLLLDETTFKRLGNAAQTSVYNPLILPNFDDAISLYKVESAAVG